MNRAEVTELFAVLMLAYPNAEMFKAPDKESLKAKLAPTITLWATCLRDVDFWAGQKAVIRVCQTCKYPPTIAEMRDAAEAELHEMKSEISNAYMMARNYIQVEESLGGTAADVLGHLPVRTVKVIEAMGGMDAFAPPDGKGYNMAGFEQTYEALLRKNPIGLPGGTTGQKQLSD